VEEEGDVDVGPGRWITPPATSFNTLTNPSCIEMSDALTLNPKP